MGDLAVRVGCMDARLASGARGAQLRAMCALQQGWVLRARRGDAPERELKEVVSPNTEHFLRLNLPKKWQG